VTSLDQSRARQKNAAIQLELARQIQERRLWIGVVQHAQVCIEECAKAVIACFARPIPVHDPSPQLRTIFRASGEVIVKACGQEVFTSLQELAVDAREASPWHTRSTYGEVTSEGIWRSAPELCTQEVAADIFTRAERSYTTLNAFLSQWAQSDEEKG